MEVVRSIASLPCTTSFIHGQSCFLLNNSIELDVVGYQFPDSPKSGKDNFDYDSNWLVLSICYTDGGISAKQKDACLLSCELLDLYKELCVLRDIQSGSYISDFMEPYLRIAA